MKNNINKKNKAQKPKKELRLKVDPLSIYQLIALRGKIKNKIEKLSDALRRKYG